MGGGSGWLVAMLGMIGRNYFGVTYLFNIYITSFLIKVTSTVQQRFLAKSWDTVRLAGF